MLRAIRLINAAKASKDKSNVMVDLHPNRPDFRGVSLPDFQMSLEADPTFAEISNAGGTISKNADAHTVLDNFFLLSGEIPRVTTYETGLRRGARFVSEKGVWEKDELILDERFVICKLKSLSTTLRLCIPLLANIYLPRSRHSSLHRLLPCRRRQCLKTRDHAW